RRTLVHGLEMARFLQASEEPDRLGDAGDLAVRDRGAHAHAGAAQPLALPERVEDRALVEAQEARRSTRQLLQQLLFAACLERGNNASGSEQFGDVHEHVALSFLSGRCAPTLARQAGVDPAEIAVAPAV